MSKSVEIYLQVLSIACEVIAVFKSWNLVFYLLLSIGVCGGYVPPVWGQETTPPAESAIPSTVTTITAIESEFSSGSLQLRLQTADNKLLAATQSERGSTLTSVPSAPTANLPPMAFNFVLIFDRSLDDSPE